jgi:enterochelin esterase-like enzyme
MKKVCIIGIWIAALALSAPGAFCGGEVRQYKVPSRFPEDLPPSKLSIYLPEGYDTSGEAYPVLYLVHGDGGNGMTFLGGGYGGTLMVDANAAAIVDGLVSGGKVRPLIVACPDMNGAASSPDELLRDVVAFVDANIRTIPRRDSRAVAGHSTGGMVSLVAALKNPDMFSVAGGLSAYLPGPYLTRLRDLAKKTDQGKLPLRIWLYAGTNDEEVPTQSDRELVGILKEYRVPVEYLEDDGDHVNRVGQRLGDYIAFLSGSMKW